MLERMPGKLPFDGFCFNASRLGETGEEKLCLRGSIPVWTFHLNEPDAFGGRMPEHEVKHPLRHSRVFVELSQQ